MLGLHGKHNSRSKDFNWDGDGQWWWMKITFVDRTWEVSSQLQGELLTKSLSIGIYFIIMNES